MTMRIKSHHSRLFRVTITLIAAFFATESCAPKGRLRARPPVQKSINQEQTQLVQDMSDSPESTMGKPTTTPRQKKARFQSGLPSGCQLNFRSRLVCLVCSHRNLSLKRCVAISRTAKPKEDCRHDKEMVQCKVSARRSISLNTDHNPEEDFIIQMNMILDTIGDILANRRNFPKQEVAIFRLVAPWIRSHATDLLSDIPPGQLSENFSQYMLNNKYNFSVRHLRSFHMVVERDIRRIRLRQSRGKLQAKDSTRFLTNLFSNLKSRSVVTMIIRDLSLDGLNSH